MSVAVDQTAIMDVLGTIPDPEMPISIVDLGLIEGVRVDADDDGAGACVTIDVLPTFVGCPALDMIRNDIIAAVGALAGVTAVRVRFLYDPAWSVDRITTAGRRSLLEHGVTVPDRGGRAVEPGPAAPVPLQTSAVRCPFCNSDSTRLLSPFGPTRCRMIQYCDACQNTFEQMKRVE